MLATLLVFLPAAILFALIYVLSSKAGPDSSRRKSFHKDF